MRLIICMFILLLTTGCVFKDYAIKKEIVRQASYGYTERCPCPYVLDSAGNDCGGRSAYSKGKDRLCYLGQVSDEMVNVYKKKHGIKDDE